MRKISKRQIKCCHEFSRLRPSLTKMGAVLLSSNGSKYIRVKRLVTEYLISSSNITYVDMYKLKFK